MDKVPITLKRLVDREEKKLSLAFSRHFRQIFGQNIIADEGRNFFIQKMENRIIMKTKMFTSLDK